MTMGMGSWDHRLGSYSPIWDSTNAGGYERKPAMSNPGCCPGILSHDRASTSKGQRPDSTPAQGNALGWQSRLIRALKGRLNRVSTIESPLQCSIRVMPPAQGVALGYDEAGR